MLAAAFSGTDLAALAVIVVLLALAAVLVAETGVDLVHGLDLGFALGYAAANVIEPVTGALLLSRLCGGQRVDLERSAGVARFLVAAVVVGPGAGAALEERVADEHDAIPAAEGQRQLRGHGFGLRGPRGALFVDQITVEFFCHGGRHSGRIPRGRRGGEHAAGRG